MIENNLKEPQSKKNILTQISHIVENYLENSILEGVYKLTHWFDTKTVIGMLAAGFIVLVTLISSLPFLRILQSNLEKEVKKQTYSLARSIVKVNRPFLDPDQRQESALDLKFALKQEGIKNAYIISSTNGRIIAPLSKQGQHPVEDFIHTVRKKETDVVKIVGSNVFASVPIKYYDPEIKNQSIIAYAVVVSESNTVNLDNETTISFIFQTFIITILLGSLFFFLLCKIFEYPFRKINYQINEMLKTDSNETISLISKNQIVNDLVSNLNTMKEQVQSSLGGGSIEIQEIDRSQEMSNLIELIGFPCFIITAHNKTISNVSADLESTTGISSSELLHQPMSNLSDQSLKQSLEILISKLETSPQEIATKSLEFQGTLYDIYSQCIYGVQSPSYFVFILSSSQQQSPENEEV